MNGDALLVKCSEARTVSEAISRLGPMLADEMRTALPDPAFPSRSAVRRQRKRTLVLMEGDRAWTAVTEGGEVADEFLARALSRDLATECVVVGLYETANAWGRRHYRSGVPTEELFEPIDAFTATEGPERDWAGDASQACGAWLESVGWSYGLPLFSQLIRGSLPRTVPPTSLVRVVIG